MACSQHPACGWTSFATRLRGTFRICRKPPLITVGKERSLGIEIDGPASSDRLDGNHVPDVLGCQVDDDEIDFILGVNAKAAPSVSDRAYPIAALEGRVGRLYLHSPQSAVPNLRRSRNVRFLRRAWQLRSPGSQPCTRMPSRPAPPSVLCCGVPVVFCPCVACRLARCEFQIAFSWRK